ncbi:PIG-L family deacetylase [Campylobacter coli]|uniref:PIG-L deacetylase family protein n=1 Tax=Campylobacter coli TaxID=195 RepID=UPI0010789DBA|nr:PIG-L family deacetylase [Campylobacter coli]ECX4022786.1 PIG-L family deacetylase [Campylobacter coli]EGH7424697.1 PIG-L family deacetylase [Campylobacter coli]EGK7587263.1 PIG-L family deacetylase [Campylobacter coli]EHA2994520.1 PIG-L family deacetylase [Campylobacter coli]
MKKILIIAAHPDDEVLGCFGTVSKFIKEGYEAYTLILGEGKTSRVANKNEIKYKEFEILENEALKANQSIGIKELFREKFPDNRFDSVPLLDIIKSIEKIKNILKPDIIFTHYAKDLNIDHQITFKAVLTATRPLINENVREIYSFEVLSSTEWNYPTSFSPNVFFDISDTLEDKIKAMSYYQSELCEFPHPRSLDGIKLQAQYHGLRVGLKNAEAFKLIRGIK